MNHVTSQGTILLSASCAVRYHNLMTNDTGTITYSHYKHLSEVYGLLVTRITYETVGKEEAES